MEKNELMTKRACVIARKLGISLEEAKKMKYGKSPTVSLNNSSQVRDKIVKDRYKIEEESDNGES